MFYKSTGGYKPHRIIMYRDGVSEGQFPHVLQVSFPSFLTSRCDGIDLVNIYACQHKFNAD